MVDVIAGTEVGAVGPSIRYSRGPWSAPISLESAS